MPDHSMMIRPLAFANTLGLTTALLAVVLIVLRLVWPTVFTFIFNAQFFGADVASLLPSSLNMLKTAGECLAFVGGGRGIRKDGGLIYNHFIRGGRP